MICMLHDKQMKKAMLERCRTPVSFTSAPNCASYHYVSGRHCAQYFLGGASNSINVGKPPDVTARNLFLPNNVVDHIGFARRSLRVWSFFECLCFENLSVGDGLYFQASTYSTDTVPNYKPMVILRY